MQDDVTNLSINDVLVYGIEAVAFLEMSKLKKWWIKTFKTVYNLVIVDNRKDFRTIPTKLRRDFSLYKNVTDLWEYKKNSRKEKI